MCRSGRTGPWKKVYPIVYFDALWSKVRENGAVPKVAVYPALGITIAGQKEVLGMWGPHSERAKFWLHVADRAEESRGPRHLYLVRRWTEGPYELIISATRPPRSWNAAVCFGSFGSRGMDRGAKGK
jgi:mutator family transposase